MVLGGREMNKRCLRSHGTYCLAVEADVKHVIKQARTACN